MKHYKLFLIILSCYCIFACVSQKQIATKPRIITSGFTKKQTLTEEEKKNWHFKDIYEDSIPGISLYKAYGFLKNRRLNDTVIVAVIDSELNIKADVFKSNLWVNKDEIPNNKLDDDKNGYVDDFNGWNFLTNSKGNYTKFYHFESTRILKQTIPFLKNSTDTIVALGSKYEIYKKAQKDFSTQLKSAERRQKHGNYLTENYDKAYALVNEFFPNKNYTAKKLDSLYLALKDSDKEKANLVYFVSDCIKYDLTKEWIDTYKLNSDNLIDKCLNLDYNERENIGDNPNDINDSIYGTARIYNDIDLSFHSSQVSAILVNHNKSKFLKIMPIVISAHGDEHDKDIAIAIRYATNNGAKIINMSLGKELSYNKEWIEDAVKYAESKDVLIVYAVGNDAKNVNNLENKYYPNDVDDNNGNEIVENFIAVGSSTKSFDKNLVSNFSNYNNKHVDIFAPGDSIYVYSPDGSNYYNSGTSLATPMVSKIAGIVRSYYPNLTAPEVKQIIMESGVSYDIMVNKPSASKEKELVPFSSLSKSGKIVNAYNALLMAEEVSKKKKKRK
ncbi:S8 family serine peptidase [Kordia sp.]|uniref:S8 family serine peptidase n=1 Tax=Kordia sp. TaxID=1965332 RepID=UPI003B58FA42